MKVSSGTIFHLFIDNDKDTIIRRPNLRRFAKDNNIPYIINADKWLIELDDFMKAVNPSNISNNYELPILRNIKESVKEFNATHTKKKYQIDKHVVEKCMNNERVFTYFDGHKWFINYKQLEQAIIDYLPKRKKYKKKRKKKNLNTIREI